MKEKLKTIQKNNVEIQQIRENVEFKPLPTQINELSNFHYNVLEFAAN
jgi:hypothetical protein